jgi:hypothetical protein
LYFADQRRGEEVGSVLLELTVAEQRFNAVMEVLRDGLTVIEVADRYGSAAKPSTPGFAATPQVAWTPWPTAPIGPGIARPHQMPAQVEARLCELRRRHPQWGQRRLATNWSGSASTHRPG